MTEVLTLLIKADNLLDNISVKGNDVYLLSDARKLMKEAFDKLVNPPEDEKGEDS